MPNVHVQNWRRSKVLGVAKNVPPCVSAFLIQKITKIFYQEFFIS